ncbi:TauD/TfdA family dioxygenase [Desertifilum sp. FACHB-1129]|uniref:TauD/TfdA-like domain-containing protein n=1 Tax=Desertifilum tharense IPPAS B-1220 TaxID=1781255 RepID=A0A1E5QNJ2_9CYAN|nr:MULTISPECIES: TauD/TfdA family dioxygenase [Desertifilum]MDA0210300.1 TauD/TfdA family dioxygenase [Cyanobacteria bacterium FC1]MBD2310246.1 TauD/TfdA family dioxygenase [Desertifilum sp. FACHB-1129]MBD2322622.1 TauD/TfdA family dioxygenase [Desertifilum sp. FACHB-866]MBD2333500.1 TauD/TfdA family dioxygenase [Desertifilum sp. FACHB-868]OEJ76167.1 hypothetical protein BH720_06350 [Desertifilum tharense IPPAS B-1220]
MTHFSSVIPLEIIPSDRAAGAEIRGVNLLEPLSPNVQEQIVQALANYGAIFFRGQSLNEEQQLTFTRAFGDTMGHPLAKAEHMSFGEGSQSDVYYLKDEPDLTYIGKNKLKGAVMWHTDLQYMPEPQVYSVLYGIEIPSKGGDTLFSNLVAAYEALDESLKQRIEHLQCVNWILRTMPPVVHPLVRIHPVSGRKALYVSPTCSRSIVDMPPGQSKSLLRYLMRHVTLPRFVWRHVWQAGDLLMWDNRHTLHCRTAFDLCERRMMRRTQTAGEPVIPT